MTINELVISRDVRFFEEELARYSTDNPRLEGESYEDLLQPLPPMQAVSPEVNEFQSD